MLKKLLLCSLAFIAVNSYSQEVPPPELPVLPFNPKNPGIHDPVMAKEGDTFYVFGTGKGITTMYSKDLKTWTEGKPIFDKLPDWVLKALPNFKGDIWAPDIIFYKGQFHIFYACHARQARCRHRPCYQPYP